MAPTPKELARTFETDVFERYATHFVALLRDSLNRPSLPVQALDLGCGTGSITLRMLNRMPAGSRIIAVSESRAEINALHRRLDPELQSRVYPRKETITRLPFAPASFDLVWCCATIHPLGPPKPIIRIAHELLRPGGQFALCTPWSGSFMELTRAVTALAKEPAHAVDVQEFLTTRPDMPARDPVRGLFSELGFTDITTQEVTLNLDLLGALAEDRLFGLHLLPLWLGRAATEPRVEALIEACGGETRQVSVQVGCVAGRKGLATS